MALINEEREVYPIGTTVRKKFNQFTHIERIIKYDEDQEWYTIEYQDGNWEEMSTKEVLKYKCTVDMSTIDNVRRLTRSSRAAALSAFKAVNNNDVIVTPDRVIPKGCVNAVFDEKTKTMMEIKALINHKNPATQKIWRRGVSNELRRLMKGGGGVKGTNTMHPILKRKMPKDKKACFSQWVGDI